MCVPCLKAKSHSLTVLLALGWLIKDTDPPLCLIGDEVCVIFAVFDDQERAVHVTSSTLLCSDSIFNGKTFLSGERMC